eukprot:212407-Amphidinium_carterae.1
MASLRRLWNEGSEAHAAVNEKLRLQSDPVHDMLGPPKVPLQERAATLEDRWRRLGPAVEISVPFEPRHALQNLVFLMKEDGVATYVEPAM